MCDVTFTKIFTAIAEKTTLRKSEGFDFGDDTHRADYNKRREFRTWALVFGSYKPNVPEIEDYTLEEALAMADDPELLKIFPPPFFVTQLDLNDTPALYFGRHSAGSLADWVQQPGSNDLEFLIVKESDDKPAVQVDILEVISQCNAPEKFIFGCKSCLESSTTFDNCCFLKRVMCPDADLLQLAYNYKIKPFLPSRGATINSHLFVSAAMLQEATSRSTFRGLREITYSNLDFSAYEHHYEIKLRALDSRKATIANMKEHCSSCSVTKVCHSTFPGKRRYCSSPLPDFSVIAQEIVRNEYDQRLSKRSIAEILSANDKRPILNPDTGKYNNSIIGLANLYKGLSFCVNRVFDNKTLFAGYTDDEWEEFKKVNEITPYQAEVQRNLEHFAKPDMFALVLACSSIKSSPVHVTIWKSTSYDYVFTDLRYHGNLSVHFHKPSSRGIAPWSLTIDSFGSIFSHYGKIPGSRW